jgi:hypothetical protein
MKKDDGERREEMEWFIAYLPKALNSATISDRFNLKPFSIELKLKPLAVVDSNLPENKIFNAVPIPWIWGKF